MTREEEIIKIFKKYDMPTSNPFFLEILKVLEPYEDCISRKSVEALLEKYTVHRAGWYTFGYQMTKELNQLPSVIPNLKMDFNGMTNGEVMKAVFPNVKVYDHPLIFTVKEMAFTDEWWNTRYSEVEK